MGHLVSLLPGPFAANAQHLQELFNEYEEGTSPEAMLVKDVDKYELLVQAVEYERDSVERGERLEGLKDLSSFFGVRSGIKTDLVKGWAEDVMKERERIWKKVSEKERTHDASGSSDV
jgi:putative hydrolases of HD superfamily